MASSGSGAPTAPQSTPSQSRNDGSSRGRGSRGRGRGKGRGRGRGNANAQDGRQKEQTASTPNLSRPAAPKEQADDARSVAVTDPDADLCFICANAVTHYSVAPCNHRTCHICGLRMRALYKTKDCAHCRTQAPFVIFTDDPEKRFEDFTPKEITSTDDNIGIRYTNEDIVGDTVLLLRYNCPDPSCDFAGLGWPDLHRHVKSAHHKRMCDLCTRNKKVFTHEHELFQDRELEKHMRHGDDRPGALDQTGFKGHPICGFCGERFYDDDKLYEHCRNKHERCFICDRRNSRQPHYFLNYNALERHFRDDHFLCLDRECLEKKFVVFESELDLKAHQLSEHGNSLSKDVRQDARIVNLADFNYRQSYQQERRGGGDRDGRGRGGGGRGRDPNSEPLPASAAQMSRDELAFQRQMAIHSAQSVSNRNFGSQLSAAPRPAPTPSRPAAAQATPSSQAPVQTQTLDSGSGPTEVDITTLSPQERARVLRHREVIDRAQNLLSNDTTKMNRFRADVSSYKNGRLTAPKFLDALFTLFSDTSSNSLGVLVRELADLFEDAKKADGLRKAWQDWRAINEDYPSLPGLGGMHGATTSNSGWAAAATASPASPAGAAAQKHSTRVLRLKSSTRQSIGGGGSSSTTSSTPAAPSSSWTAAAGAGMGSRGPPPTASSFPALPVASRPAPSSAASRPSWVGSAAGSGQGGTNLRARPERGEDAFPALPAAPKPLTSIFGYGRGSVRRDWGQTRDTGFSWGGDAQQQQAEASGADTPDEGTGKKKKGKKVLVQWG